MPKPNNKKNKNYRIVVAAGTNEAEIFIYDSIGPWGVTASELVKEINELTVSCIRLRLNSPGGSVTDGFAIYSALTQHPAEIIAQVDGFAASIASVIALAADEVIMAENAFFMIHNPTVWLEGEADALRRMAETLEKMTTNIVKIYMGKTGMSDEDTRDLMDKESWFAAEEAIELGFADSIINAIDDEAEAETALVALSAYKHIPEELLQRIAAKAPSTRGIEKGLRDAGLSRSEAREAVAKIHSNPELWDAVKDGQRDAGSKNININIIKGDKQMLIKCTHCGSDHENGTTCTCPNAQAAKAAIDAAAGLPAPAVTLNVQAEKEKAVAEFKAGEVLRNTEIIALGKAHKFDTQASEAVANGTTVVDFKDLILKDGLKGTPTDEKPGVGMSTNDIQKYSLVKAINEMAVSGQVTGLEKEMSDATALKKGKAAKGFLVPYDIMAAPPRNDLSAGDSTKGGYTVGSEVLGGSMIELLRNRMVLGNMGATILTGLTGNIMIPKVSGGGQAYWLPENGEVTTGDQEFASIGLTPHRLVGNTAYSKELVMQSSIDVEAFVRNDLVTVLALAKDLAGFNGSGVAGQPRGIMQTDGISGVTFGAAPTWPKVVEFETDVAALNADVANMAYVTAAGVRGAWKTTEKTSGQPVFLWEDGPQLGVGQVNGYAAHVTNQIPDNKVIFGNFADLLIAMWEGMDIVVDPYSQKKKGLIEVTVTEWVDFGVRHPESFSVSTDAGNQ